MEKSVSVQYITFETYQSLEPPSTIPGGDRRVQPLTFLYKIYCSRTLILSIFLYIAYF